MQLKKIYPKMSILGIAAAIAFTACGDDNAEATFANAPGTSIADNPVPGSSSDMHNSPHRIFKLCHCS